ncbi:MULTISPECIES: hypothetical protein [Vibrio]|uniref:hypothetical protein n=1 Tax=Vibrio TaxID=662 RepID=UPI0008240308|nr:MULTISPECIES: hypothetical protein [Vibrio]MCS0342141.1 hypothetical protein [Vibrio diabolicus]MDW1980275.1 hypothetical protein [Vibrio sp. Vb0304]
MELPATVFVAGGAIIASLITGLITFTNILISKDQKTSEFRQDWIDRVRGEVSLFTSSVADYTSHLVAKKEDPDALDKFYDDNIKLTGEITRSYNSLRLHLNKVDDKEIVDILGDLYEFAAKGEIDFKVEDVTKKENELISLTQDMLKKEWTRVKAGEKTYQFMKWFGLFMIIAPLLVIAMNYQYIATFWAP